MCVRVRSHPRPRELGCSQVADWVNKFLRAQRASAGTKLWETRFVPEAAAQQLKV